MGKGKAEIGKVESGNQRTQNREQELVSVFQLSTFNFQLFPFPLSPFSFQLSAFNFQLFPFVRLIIVVMIAMSSSASFSIGNVSAEGMAQCSRRSSSQRADSSAS